jgi:hypothetical protein
MVLILQAVLGVLFAGASLLFWIRVTGRGEDRFREAIARRYRGSISRTLRGHWQVTGARSRLAGLGIELLQLGYFMAAFAAWASGMLVVFGLMNGLEILFEAAAVTP